MNNKELDRVYRDYFRREAPADATAAQERTGEPAGLWQPQPGDAGRGHCGPVLPGPLALRQHRTDAAAGEDGPTNLMNNAEADGKKILDAAKEPPMPEMP